MKNKNQPIKPLFTNVSPQMPEAEAAVIGAIIGSGNAYDQVSFLTPEMFYDNRHRYLYEAILSLKSRDAAVDLITVAQEIGAMGKLEEVSMYYIAGVTGNVVSAAHIVEHALIVKQKFLQRQLIELSQQLQGKAGNDTEDIEDVLSDAEKGIEQLQDIMIGHQEESSYYEISKMFYDDLNLRINKFSANTQTGVVTGLTKLDQITSGWQGSDLIIIAGRPAMGKTAVALHLAHSAAQAGKTVVMFSLEMSKVALYQRSILAEDDEISSMGLKSGNVQNELKKIDQAVARLCNLPIYVDDNGSLTMAHIRAKCRMMYKKNKCDVIIIDYLQLIFVAKTRYGNREQEIAAISRECKMMAKELGVPVLLLSQLNREVEKRSDKRPLLSDLRESGSIEQDADMVMFVHRPEYYGLTIQDAQGNPVKQAGELIIAKYRNGSTGRVKFRHNSTLTRITDF